MDTDEQRTAFIAARNAQEDLQAYLSDLSRGLVPLDRARARALVKKCEDTFNAWRALFPDLTEH